MPRGIGRMKNWNKLGELPRKHVQEIQLKIWLVKTLGERLFQIFTENDVLYKAILKVKEDIKNNLPLLPEKE